MVWKLRENLQLEILAPNFIFFYKLFLSLKIIFKFFNSTKPAIAGLGFLNFEIWILDLHKKISFQNLYKVNGWKKTNKGNL